MAKTKVIQKEGSEPVPAEVIAQSIKTIADSVKRLDGAGLNEKCIKVLLRHSSGESDRAVSNVLYALRNLEREYLAKAASK